jgi:hypothetical protein
MGYARWSHDDWDHYVRGNIRKSIDEIFSNCLVSDLDPRNVSFRESRDSAENPLSTPIIVAVDQTGSMGFLAESLIREGLGTLVESIYERKPVTDPHVMCMALGDAWTDRAPLQVTQFEADIIIAEQLSKFYIEANGGGNNFESYNLPWFFAATRTRCDSWLKRQKKGFLFTVGDEPPPPELKASHVKTFLAGGLQHDIRSAELLKLTMQTWEVFHLIAEEGSYFRSKPRQTTDAWRALLGRRALALHDHRNLPELIVSIIQVMQGESPQEVAYSWKGSTAKVIMRALKELAFPQLPMIRA